MTHNMKLKPNPFAKIASGSKTIELRLYDDKRQQLSVGDTIIFTSMEDSGLQLKTRVVALHKFSSFRNLFEALPMEACGYDSEMPVEDALVNIRRYYSEKREEQYGVLGIEIQLLD